jgi:SAM-dependent methyltransferase
MPQNDNIVDQVAAKYSVCAAIHPEDHIFNFVMHHPGFPSDEDRVEYYFRDGQTSARQFLEIVERHVGLARTRDLLEFASGYGCVTRHLIKMTERLLCCDIHPQAIDFLQKKIGVKAIQSASRPELLQLPTQADVVFALSFFSHMPITTWARWLVSLCQAVKPGGILVFTTHGHASRKFLGNPEIPSLGFWYEPRSEQADLPVEQYGLTLTTPEFVTKNLLTIPFVALVETREAYWWGHQDLYVVQKDS